jgi:hypothetical protein
VQRNGGHRVDVSVVEGGQLPLSPLLLCGSVACLPRIQRYFLSFFFSKVSHQRAEQLLPIKCAEVNVAQVFTFPVVLQGVVQRDGSHRVDVSRRGRRIPVPVAFLETAGSCSRCLSRSSCCARRYCFAEVPRASPAFSDAFFLSKVAH